jgi:hypothetical protein
MPIELLVVFLLIVFNGFFALSEMAVMTSRKSRLRQNALTDKRAQTALELAEAPDRFLSAVQVWISLLGILTGYFGGGSLSRVLEGRLEKVDRSEDVDLRVVVGPGDGGTHVDLRREVVADGRLHAREELVLRLADVAFDELDALRQVLGLARREVVEDHDVLAARDERFHDMRADEPRSPGDEHCHGPILSRCS